MSARELTVFIAVCAVWGLHFVVVKVAVSAVPPIFYAALRMSLVAILLVPWLRWRPGQMRRVLAAGVCFGALNYALMFSGVERATASAAAVAVELYVPFATILSVLFLGEKVGWRRICGITLAFAGVAVIALRKSGGGEGGQIGLGVALVAGGALAEAIGAILVKRAQGFKPHELLAWFGTTGAVLLWGITWVVEGGQIAALRAADPVMLAGAVAFSALGASLFAHTAFYWLLQRLPVSQVSLSALLTTLFAVAFSVMLLGDPMTVSFVIGGVMALCGVGVVLARAPKGPLVEPGAGGVATTSTTPEPQSDVKR